MQVFEGVGSTKKQAKHLAAVKAIEYLTADGGIDVSTTGMSITDLTTTVPKIEIGGSLPALVSTAGNKNPVSLMNEIKPTAKYSLISESGESHNKLFSFSVEVDGQIFIGSGKNKRLAKARAAQNALQSLYGISFFSSPGMFYPILLIISGLREVNIFVKTS